MKGGGLHSGTVRHPGWLLRVARCVALVLVLAVLVLLFYLQRRGISESVVNRVFGPVRTNEFAVRFERVRWTWPNRLALDHVRVYRRGVIGLPALDLTDLVIGIDLPGALSGGNPLRELRARGGEVRPFQMRKQGGPSGGQGGASPLADVPVRAEDIRVQGVMFPSIEGRLQVLGARVRFEGARLRTASAGYVADWEGTAVYDDGTEVLTIDTAMRGNPRSLVPMLREWEMPTTCEILERFAFPGPPARMQGRLVYGFRSEGMVSLRAEFWLSDFAYRGIAATRADGELQVLVGPDSFSVTVRPLLVLCGTETARGGLTYLPNPGRLQFDISSTLPPETVFRAVDLYDPAVMTNFSFRGPVQAVASGEVHFVDADATRIRIAANARDLRVLWMDAEDARVDLRMEGLTQHFERVHANLYGGQAAGVGSVLLPRAADEPWRFAMDVEAGEMRFADVMRALMGEVDPQLSGKLRVKMNLQGPLDGLRTAEFTGGGDLSVQEGRVFLLPVFGGLSDWIARIVPGIDFVLRQSNLRSSFAVTNGWVRSEDVRIEGPIFSLTGSGQFSHPGGRLDYKVVVRLLQDQTILDKVVRFVTYPVSKLFEFRLSGTLEEPSWFPLNFSLLRPASREESAPP